MITKSYKCSLSDCEAQFEITATKETIENLDALAPLVRCNEHVFVVTDSPAPPAEKQEE